MAEEERLTDLDDDAYLSEDDEDFAPENDRDLTDSDSDNGLRAEDTPTPAGRARNAAANAKSGNDIGEIGQDEVNGLYQDAGKKRKHGEAGDDESGGEGGFVRTRRMAAEQTDAAQRPLASVNGATVDVDAMWQAMSNADFGPVRAAPTPKPSPSKQATEGARFAASPSKPPVARPGTDMVDVTETYEFAGEIHTRIVRVPRASVNEVEAGNSGVAQKRAPDGTLLYRPLRRVSAFEPNPQGIVRGLPRPGSDNSKERKDSKNKNKGPRHAYTIPRVKQPKKLNVVDKSKLDWQSHVDATGQRDELEAAKKGKDAFLERQDFLGRVEGRAEDLRAAAKGR